MGNGYNHHHLQQQRFYNRNTFLPLLCRVSIKDVKLKDYKDRSSFFSDDPSSPKVSCMGQVNRNNKVIGFPTPYRLTSTTTTTTTTTAVTSKNHNNFKYTKLKRLFSGKNLTPATATTSTTTTTTKSSKAMIRRSGSSRRSSKINNDDGQNQYHDVQVNISELDPPLPVIQKVQQSSEVNLWKRRSGGLALKTLQIEHQMHLPNNRYLPAPTV